MALKPGSIAPKKFPDFVRNFEGAVGVANWLKQHHFDCAAPANIADGNVWPKFKNAVEAYKGKEIKLFFDADLTKESVKYELPSEVRIHIPQSFNLCHRRFAVCKELTHVLMDQYFPAQDSSQGPLAQLIHSLMTTQYVIESKRIAAELNPLFQLDVKLPSEPFCFLLTMEILIPVKDRDTIITDITVKNKNTFDVASHYRIPESLVIFFAKSGYNFIFKRMGGSEIKIK